MVDSVYGKGRSCYAPALLLAYSPNVVEEGFCEVRLEQGPILVHMGDTLHPGRGYAISIAIQHGGAAVSRLSPFQKGEGKMLRTVASKVAWVGRTASMVFGLALVMALVFGVATMAMGATGGNFLLGKNNVADAISTLIKRGPGPALSLVVEANQPPLKVNATAGKATNLNADEVDGLEGASLVQGGGRASQGMVALPVGTSATILNTSNPNLQLSYVCPNNLANDGLLKIKNTGTELVNFFVKEDRGPTFYAQLQPGGTADTGMASIGDHATIQVQGTNVVTIEAFTAHRPTGIVFSSNDCHTQAQALATR